MITTELFGSANLFAQLTSFMQIGEWILKLFGIITFKYLKTLVFCPFLAIKLFFRTSLIHSRIKNLHKIFLHVLHRILIYWICESRSLMLLIEGFTKFILVSSRF